MTLTDIFVALGLILYVVLGFRDGFFKKVFGILSFLGGLILATKLMTPAGDTIQSWLDLSKEASVILGFFLVFLVFVLIVNLSYRWFGRSASDTLSSRSRIVGSFLGAAQGAVAISLVLLMFRIFDVPSETTRKESVFYGSFIQIAPIVFDYTTAWIPESKTFFEELKNKFEKFNIAQ